MTRCYSGCRQSRTVILVLAEKAPADLAGATSLTDAALAESAHLQPALTLGERYGTAAPPADLQDPIGDLAGSAGPRMR